MVADLIPAPELDAVQLSPAARRRRYADLCPTDRHRADVAWRLARPGVALLDEFASSFDRASARDFAVSVRAAGPGQGRSRYPCCGHRAYHGETIWTI